MVEDNSTQPQEDVKDTSLAILRGKKCTYMCFAHPSPEPPVRGGGDHGR